jgi:hypothetical protein
MAECTNSARSYYAVLFADFRRKKPTHRAIGAPLAVMAALGILLAVVGTPAPAAPGAVGPTVVQPWADPSPSPTLGSTESPNPNPPGDPDSDPADYSGAIWAVVAAAGAAVLIGVATLFWLRGRQPDRRPRPPV